MLRTKVLPSGALAVYLGQAKVGYVVASLPDWHWEVILVSERYRGHPRGKESSKEVALRRVEEVVTNWMRAAGVRLTPQEER